jgi:hypothetical protein
VRLTLEDDVLHSELIDAVTGEAEDRWSTPLKLPAYPDPSAYGVFGLPPPEVRFRTLADTDADGYWNALVQIRDFVVDIHLPFEVHPGYSSYAPIPYGNIDNGGALYDVGVSSFQSLSLVDP